MNNHFFIIGAQRCGTTLLTKILDSHEQICMAKPLRPEPKFFLKPIEKFNYIDYFEKFFDIRGKYSAYGEKSTSYIESKIAPEQINKYLPNAKLILILRDPVKRAISNYFFSKNNKIENLDFETALKNENIRKNLINYEVSVSPFAYFNRGIYINYIETWINYFDRKKILIIIFEELINKKNVDYIYDFLEVDVPKKKIDFSKENESFRLDIEISNKTIQELTKKYHSYNIALANKFNLEVSYWLGMK